MPKGKSLNKVLNSWSVSKLTCLLDCPRLFDIRYIRNAKAPHAPNKVLGTVIHYFFDRFFKVHFKNKTSFAKAAQGYWAGIVNGDHGPHSYSGKISDPIEIYWGGRDAGMYYGMLWRALTTFWDNNIVFREQGNIPLTEQNFSIRLCGKNVRGIIDRIQQVEDGFEIWDYKASTPTDATLALDLQLTLYNYWFLMHHGKPPVRIGHYNYFARQNPLKLGPARVQNDFDRLMLLFNEAGEYVRTVITGELSHPWAVDGFNHFLQADIMTGRMMPTHAVGGYHCKGCEFSNLCLQIEQGNEPTTREFVRREYGKWKPPVKEADRAYLFKGSEDDPMRRRQLLHAVEQRRVLPLKSLIDPPEQLLHMMPKVEKRCDSLTPTQYGRCPNCGFALSRNLKCGNCLAWYSKAGIFLPEKTFKSISRRVAKKDKKWKAERYPALLALMQKSTADVS